MNSLSPMPGTLSEGRSLLTLDVPEARRKQLGQCFTGLRTGRLLAALALRDGQKRMADPMAGHGDLLEAAAERAARIHSSPDELFGVEIEREAARLGEWRVQQCAKEFGVGHGTFVRGDAFATTTWEAVQKFDLVITNPPYVRYQTLSNGGQASGTKLLNSDQVRLALGKLVDMLAPVEERLVWQRLIRSYSGLADLSVPSWILCGLLTAPSGVLALVVPQTWLNRDYARIARYFLLRFFQPLAVVQESGQRWFRDALVPVSLVVGRRLSSAEALTPLSARSGDATPFAEIESAAASTQSHVGNAFRGDDPELEFSAWLERGSGTRAGVRLKRVAWEAQRDELLAAPRPPEWLRRLEGETGKRHFVASAYCGLPASVAHRLPAELLGGLRPLSEEGISVGQGLRTGCNPFFYVELAGDGPEGKMASIVTHELFGKRRVEIPSGALKPVLRRQVELTSLRVPLEELRGRVLDLRLFVLPEDAPRNGFAPRSQWRVMSEPLAEYVRLAARTHLIRGETKTLIPLLSAVRPNGLGPTDKLKTPSLLGSEPARMWYMLPDFAPRHLSSLVVPRIIHDEPVAFLNSEPPVLIDANFSTLWCGRSNWNAKTLFAILNSTWGELCMEALGAILGGGALKLEATHLRQLPVPEFSSSAKQRLDELVTEVLESNSSLDEFRKRHRLKIDQVILSALTQRETNTRDVKITVGKLSEIARSLRAKRRRNSKKEPQDEE